jgi:hypothetical protein
VLRPPRRGIIFSASTYRVKDNDYDTYAPHFPNWNLEKVRVPTAVFAGDSDIITTPLEALKLARGIANATLGVRNAGHFPWLQQRDTFFKDFTQAAQIILKGRRCAFGRIRLIQLWATLEHDGSGTTPTNTGPLLASVFVSRCGIGDVRYSTCTL